MKMFRRRIRERLAIGLAIVFIGVIFYLASLTNFSSPVSSLSKDVVSSFFPKSSIDLDKHSVQLAKLQQDSPGDTVEGEKTIQMSSGGGLQLDISHLSFPD
jgi:hypothetical protein